MNCDAYFGFWALLIKHIAQFRKLVLLVHGDINPYYPDKDFGGAATQKFWRLNTSGDCHKPLDATVVTVDVKNQVLLFDVNCLVGS